ncbi:MAG: glycosyltransferase, partial [Candidatus Micrarchaeota archaeon]
RVFVFSPAHNEENVLSEFVSRFAKMARNVPSDLRFSLLIINDGSTDGSKPLLSRLSRKYSFLKVKNTRRNGPMKTVFDGFEEGLRSSADVILRLDSDLEHQPEKIPALIKLHDSGAGMAVGLMHYSLRVGVMDYSFNRISGYFSGKKVAGRPFPQFCPGFISFTKPALKKVLPALRVLAEKFERSKGEQMTSIDLVAIAAARVCGVRVSFLDLDGSALGSSRGFKKIVRYIRLYAKTMRFLKEERLVH